MEFDIIASLFKRISETSKKLEKTLILRDFYLNYPENSPLLFDCIAGNYQREIGKKTLGISTKTLLDTLAFISKQSQQTLEKEFNKKGDIGFVATSVFSQKKQTALETKTLTFNQITQALSLISKKSGSKTNTFKKEILSNLFLSTQNENEMKYLARFLIDDLRIGVSQGILKESLTYALFPKIINYHILCDNCDYINPFSMKNCFNCSNQLNTTNQKEIVTKQFALHECKTPETIQSLDNFVKTRDKKEELAYILRTTKSNEFISTSTPRELFILFQQTLEKQYNTLNSFQKLIKKANKSLESCISPSLELHQPVLSMLGTNTTSFEQAFEMTKTPALIDYKYDGLRVQIHNEYGNVTLFSRNLDIITKQFPEIVEFIKTNFSNETFILDTECVGYDSKKKQFLPFQTLSRRILTKDVSSVKTISVVVKAFDILLHNEKTLIEFPYEKRREILDSLFIGKTIIQQ